MAAMISLRDVSFAYPGSRAPQLDGITLDIPRGSFVGIAGPNGAGKSTLLKLLAGIVETRSGTIRIEDMPLSRMPRRALSARVAWASQSPAFPPSTCVEDFILAGRFPHLGFFTPMSQGDRDIVGRYLEALDLVSMRRTDVMDLSGGDRQRAAVARTLAARAGVVLLDEPLAHLDPRHHEMIYAALDSERREGRTILMTSHDFNALRRLADRLLLMKQGRILAYAPTGDVSRSAWEGLFDVSFEEIRTGGGDDWIIPSMRRP